VQGIASQCTTSLVRLHVCGSQQSDQIRDHTDLRVGALCGEMGVDWWDAGRWKRVLDEHDVLVSTPQVCCSRCTVLRVMT
jgi:hypothetical protein